jgi:hypothetical protein
MQLRAGAFGCKRNGRRTLSQTTQLSHNPDATHGAEPLANAFQANCTFSVIAAIMTATCAVYTHASRHVTYAPSHLQTRLAHSP